ncbi:restriction endonuclease fold toxin-2 domain-containing protein [Dactylosporangium sp. CS-033363]|uniref:restriction endonuclease fold toxin-2 domain-containing protein n=1 Tax=Dactylosporangium sp. CS-033363 TaxID=3239935 RepID=UPI003D8D672F
MSPARVFRAALVLLAAVAALLLASPGAALACGISYETIPGSPAAGCSEPAALTGIVVVGAAAAALVGTWLVRSFLSGAMSATELANLIEQIQLGSAVGDTVTLIDGTERVLLDAAGQAGMRAYAQRLDAANLTRAVTQAGPQYDYQRDKLGATEYNVAPGGGRQTWADGLDGQRGSAQDAKYRGSHKNSSFYYPPSMPEKLRNFAVVDIDKRLQKYLDAIEDPANPLEILEIVTNDIEVATFMRERMVAVGVPGFIRVEI